MKKSSKTEVTKTQYYIESDRKNALYRIVNDETPEYKDCDGAGWTRSDEYPTADHLRGSRTIGGENWAVVKVTLAAAKKLILQQS